MTNKKSIKKIAATSLICAALAATTTGCVSILQPKLSLLEVMQSGNNITTGNITADGNFSIDNSSMKLFVDAQQSNKNFGFNKIRFVLNEESNDENEKSINYDLSCNNFIKNVDGMCYINTPELVKTLNDVITYGSSNDDEIKTIEKYIEEAGLELNFNDIGWIELPSVEISDDALQSQITLNKKSVSILEKAIMTSEVDVINEEKNAYKMTITDKKKLAAFLNSIAEQQEENKESYIQESTNILKSFDGNSLVDKYISLTIDTVKAACDELGIVYQDEDLNDIESIIRDEIKENNINEDELINTYTENISKSYDELIQTIKDFAKSCENSENATDFKATYEVSLTGQQGEQVYNQNISFETSKYIDENENDEDSIPEKSEMKLSLSIILTENDIQIAAPENRTDIPNFVKYLINAIKSSEIGNSANLDTLKGQSLSDIIALAGQATNPIDKEFFGNSSDKYLDSDYNEIYTSESDGINDTNGIDYNLNLDSDFSIFDNESSDYDLGEDTYLGTETENESSEELSFWN